MNKVTINIDELRRSRLEADLAFEKAISDGRLTHNKLDENWVGNYMYMGTWEKKDQFKNKITRAYIA